MDGYGGEFMTIELPVGRKLFYYKPEFKDKKIGRSTVPIRSLCYRGIDQTTKQWISIDTYGGKLTENIVQAVSRDLLGDAMLRMEKAGYGIVGSIHDEVITEVPEENAQLWYDNLVKIMSTPPLWAQDLPLNADGGVMDFYQK